MTAPADRPETVQVSANVFAYSAMPDLLTEAQVRAQSEGQRDLKMIAMLHSFSNTKGLRMLARWEWGLHDMSSMTTFPPHSSLSVPTTTNCSRTSLRPTRCASGCSPRPRR